MECCCAGLTNGREETDGTEQGTSQTPIVAPVPSMSLMVAAGKVCTKGARLPLRVFVSP